MSVIENPVWTLARLGRSALEAALGRAETGKIRDAFLRDGTEAVEEVRSWVRAVVHGGWRFPDPDAVVQEIMLELVRLGRGGGIRKAPDFRAYVRTVARHSCVDAFRRERVRQTQPLDDVYFEIPGAPDGDPEQRYLEQRRRELLRWAHGDDMTSSQIAERLGISAGAARVRLHRCLERARELHRESIR
ncbi:MAG: sigma-70 family RNA polymerase sigma factor [Acidobacteriota bacterium]|nr:sigma-70 family RNA polymerase sigma factor [Acidobacteriota bacterium]